MSNEMPDETSSLLDRALDPARSVVVEACAGSGKTWLLASRIVCLLLCGVAPGEILAITFTRKAAREIEERVIAWLHLLATGTEAQAAQFLTERGLAADEAHLRAARALYERVLSAHPRLTVNTFHGWFLQLIAHAPLSSGLTGNTLVDSNSLLFDELWQSFIARFQGNTENATAQSLVRLLEYGDYDFVRPMIRRAMERRAEWLAYGGDKGDTAEKILADLRQRSGAGEPGEALAHFFAHFPKTEFHTYLAFLEKGTPTEQRAAEKRDAALDENKPLPERFDALRTIFLTQENTLRKKTLTSALERRLGVEGAPAFIELHLRLGESLLVCIEGQIAENILVFNRDACAVFSAFLAHVESFRQARQQMDFTDAEWHVFRMLHDEETAAFLQARLDARYRHVLLDEFQDTNPLQWQSVLAWLDAYSDDTRPTVFLVGDPKQSIYRFRRADPRLFASASTFLKNEYSALSCYQDTTRRNAPPIIDTVNALFLDRAEFAPFRRQKSQASSLPGRVELLPLCQNPAQEEKKSPSLTLRNPLTEPEIEPEDKRREQEAERLALKIGEIVGKNGSAWQIIDTLPDGKTLPRPARYGDIMLLVRSRTHLAHYERALAAAAVPFEVGSHGGLLVALEIQDCVALLDFLVMPKDDLKLAQVLKSPLFACHDEELMQLVPQEKDISWWERLKEAAKKSGASPRIRRAARLLAEWLEIANRLPAHDLIDRIFHEGEIIARYRRAVPETLAASVEANLRALLLLALDLDAGRYPSLPRFIDALREFRDADASDAPDKGEINALQDNRVRILTIHGAKGLEAPIVWLLGAHENPRHGESFGVILDWPSHSARPTHFSFYTRLPERGAFRKALFEAEAAAEKREELNLLYVAITRARQVFIASGIENARGSDASFYRLLENALETLKSGRTQEGGYVYGETLPCVPADLPQKAFLPDTLPVPEEPPPAIGKYRTETDDAPLRFGLLFHALIEDRMKGECHENSGKTFGLDDEDYRRASAIIENLLKNPDLQCFFDPAHYRRAWNEVELTDCEGRLMRIDRMIDHGDTLWILDYKSSRPDTERMEEYREQVSGYCRVVSSLFPAKKVRGALLFSDACLVEVTPAPQNETVP